MKFNKWTLGLAAVGAVSLASAVRADEAPKMSQVQTALSNTTLSGYVDVSAQWNVGSQNLWNANGNSYGVPGYGYGAGKADGFNLDSVDLALDHPEDNSPWAAGYHVELMAGPDNPLGSYSDATGIRQAYVTVRTPVGSGIDWKVGVFDTVIGYESTSDPSNPNFTRSYGYSIEPTTHTGFVATYNVTGWLTIAAGVANSSNIGMNAPYALNGRATFETQKTYLGSVALTAPDSWGWAKGGTLNLGVVHSLDSAAAGIGERDNYYAGITVPTPWSKLKVGGAFDWFNSDAALNVGSAYTYVIGAYATLQATDKLSFNARAEYLNDGSSDLNLYSGNVYPAFSSEVHAEEITLTTQYNLWANVISRVEFRWDHLENGTPFGSNLTNGDPNRGNSFILAANLIYQF